MKKRNVRILSLFLTLMMFCLIISPASAATSATASTMRLSQYTGTVNVTNASGRVLTEWSNMQLYSGYHVETKAKSYAWVNLDNTKLAKLDASSKVQIRKSGSRLELLLQSGHVYFNVTSPLTSDETLNVRTSTTVTGIRGTCGWVNVVDRWTTEVYVLEGSVQCNVTDPVTGQAKTTTVESGEKAVAVAYPQDWEGDKCEFIQEQIEIEDINGFVLEELIQDPGLREDIYEKSGLDLRDITEEAVQERLEQDERELQEKLDDVEAELAGQDNNVFAGSVWEQGSSKPEPSAGDGTMPPRPAPTPEPSPEPAAPDEMTMPKTAGEVQALFEKYDTVILKASGNAADDKLTVNTEMTIKSGQSLTVSDGISVEIVSDGFLRVEGMMAGGNGSTLAIEDGAALIVSGSGTLDMQNIINEGFLEIDAAGTIKTANLTTFGTINSETSGYFSSKGIIEGTITVTGGDAEISGGEVISSSSGATVRCTGGKINLEGGTITNTNSVSGYALSANDAVNITFGGICFRARTADIIQVGGASYSPEGFTSYEEDGYYCLAFVGGGTTTDNGSGDVLPGPEPSDTAAIGSTVRSTGAPLFAGNTTLWTPGLFARTTVQAAFADGGGAYPFADVPDTAWYGEAVRYVYENGLMGDAGGGKFSPGSATSRGMLVTILHRMEGKPSAPAANFTDVPAGKWYTDAVAWASANEIVYGYGSTFKPDDPLTREQMSVILYRYARYKGYDVTATGDVSAFPDRDSVSAYAADAVNWAVGAGLIQGSGGMLLPGGGAIRAQAATVLMRFCTEVATRTMTVLSSMDVMCEPSGIFFLTDGSFLVTDTYNNVIWRVADGAGTVYAGGVTASGLYDRPMGGYNDAGPEDSYFSSPWAIAPFLGGCAVTDMDNNVVRLIKTETIQANSGAKEKLTVTNIGVAFSHPTGLAADEAGNLYVSETFAGTVRKITPEGNVTIFAKNLTDPMGLCWKDGALYIAETGANRIVKTAGGQVTVVAGSGEDGFVDGSAAKAAFSAPQGVAVGDDGTVYVSDTVNGAVRRIKNGQVTTLVRRDESDLDSYIPVSPVGLTLHGDQLYVCDSFARKVFVISTAP